MSRLPFWPQERLLCCKLALQPLSAGDVVFWLLSDYGRGGFIFIEVGRSAAAPNELSGGMFRLGTIVCHILFQVQKIDYFSDRCVVN
jgi:hypothetical protein